MRGDLVLSGLRARKVGGACGMEAMLTVRVSARVVELENPLLKAGVVRKRGKKPPVRFVVDESFREYSQHERFESNHAMLTV